MFVYQTNSLHINVWKPLLSSQMWSLLVNELAQVTETCCGDLQGVSPCSLGKAGTARAQILHCRIPFVPHIYWFSAGSGPPRGKDHYCRVHWTCERMLTTHTQGGEENPSAVTASKPVTEWTQGTQGTVLCALHCSWVNPQPWRVFWQTFGCSSSSQQLCPFKFPLGFNIFTTYWQDAVCTHFSYVYIHIIQTRACSETIFRCLQTCIFFSFLDSPSSTGK